MPKFPDPSKIYEAKPVEGQLDMTQKTKDSEEGVEQSPKTPVYEPPPVFATSTKPTTSASSPPPAPPPTPPKGPVSPESFVSPSPFRNLIPLILGILAFALIAFLAIRLIPTLYGRSNKSVTLTYWGLWEPPSVMEGVIADYERDNPGITINYEMQSPKNYRSRLQSAIQDGTGPDIARIHNTWLPMLRRSLSPKPDGVELDVNAYYPVVQKDFVVGGKLYAAPLEIDGLALYYNKDILAEVGATPPTDWNALRRLAFDLTKRNIVTGIIERAGVAMGTATNVDYWSDILGLLILQNSGSPADPASQPVQDALTFYTIFSTSDKSWDVTQPNSTYAFATGSVAMIIAPSWINSEIQAINPSLNYAVAPAPTLPNTKLAWATYWGEAVPTSSKNQQEAWKFLAYLSQAKVLTKLYSAETSLRPIGEPYPLKSLASTLADDPLAGAFVSQGDGYTSWYLADKTGDEGVNDELAKYYEDALTSINNGSSVEGITKTLQEGVAQVLAKYPEAK